MPIIRTVILSKETEKYVEKIPKGRISQTIDEILLAYFKENPIVSESTRRTKRVERYPAKELKASEL